MILLQILTKNQMQIRCFEIKENNSGYGQKKNDLRAELWYNVCMKKHGYKRQKI